jgi:AcrR family transcriptional regulator
MARDDGVVWERPEPPRRAAPSELSRERIVAAALALADADGLAAVSLRKVAAELDAGPMRLYRYVATKDELLDLMLDAVYGEISIRRPPGAHWRAALRSLATRTRGAALRHEWFADLLGGRPHLGPNALAYGEATLSAVYGAPGFGDVDAAQEVAGALNAYVVGAIRREVAGLRAERATGLDTNAWQRANGPYLDRALSTGRYPTLSAVVHDATHPSPETTFTSGLDLLLDGVAARHSA